AIDPEFAPAYSRLGIVEVTEEGDFQTAASHYRHALELSPNDPELQLAAADFLSRLGRFEPAIAVAQRVTLADPVNAFAHYRLGVINLYAHHWDAAIASLNTTLTLSPGFSGAQHLLGIALLGKGENEQALTAMSAEIGDPEYRVHGIAMAEHALGRQAEF